ncbi:MAG: transposase family protein [Chloroflexi bacterium]|nr:transposase family protein [Chloroflexota bacterium]
MQHDGGNPGGFFACTLDVTDVSTGWTEMRSVPTKAQTHVFAALAHIRTKLPFPLLGLDWDNGAEFINDELLRYCRRERLTFTRGRVGRKNDNPFVEQRNWSVVRRLVGYGRYATQRQVDQLNRLYAIYRLYVNRFLPVQKLVIKVREGSRVKKIYDDPRTPYQRVLDSDQVGKEAKRKRRAMHARLDVVELKHRLEDLLAQLIPARQW